MASPAESSLSRINGEINRMSDVQLRAELDRLKLESGGEVGVLKRRLKEHARHGQGAMALPDSDVRNLDYLCVFDFEATCELKDKVTDQLQFPHEIIEFPVILIRTSTLEKVAEFHSYVRPVLNPILTPFCTELTGITQAQVDTADEFPVVLARLQVWMANYGLGVSHTFSFASDGPWDFRDFFTMQCIFSGIKRPEFSRSWINIRKHFSNKYKERSGVDGMLKTLGLSFEGRPHCGLDDARNIARILVAVSFLSNTRYMHLLV